MHPRFGPPGMRSNGFPPFRPNFLGPQFPPRAAGPPPPWAFDGGPPPNFQMRGPRPFLRRPFPGIIHHRDVKIEDDEEEAEEEEEYGEYDEEEEEEEFADDDDGFGEDDYECAEEEEEEPMPFSRRFSTSTFSRRGLPDFRLFPNAGIPPFAGGEGVNFELFPRRNQFESDAFGPPLGRFPLGPPFPGPPFPGPRFPVDDFGPGGAGICGPPPVRPPNSGPFPPQINELLGGGFMPNDDFGDHHYGSNRAEPFNDPFGGPGNVLPMRRPLLSSQRQPLLGNANYGFYERDVPPLLGGSFSYDEEQALANFASERYNPETLDDYNTHLAEQYCSFSVRQYYKAYQRFMYDYDPKFAWDDDDVKEKKLDAIDEKIHADLKISKDPDNPHENIMLCGESWEWSGDWRYFEAQRRRRELTEYEDKPKPMPAPPKLPKWQRGRIFDSYEWEGVTDEFGHPLLQPSDRLEKCLVEEIGFPENWCRSDYCGTCDAVFNSVITSMNHYTSEKHDKAVTRWFVDKILTRRYLIKEELSKEWVTNALRRVKKRLKVNPESWVCDTCQDIKLSSLAAAIIHYKSATHRRAEKGLPKIKKMPRELREKYRMRCVPCSAMFSNDAEIHEHINLPTHIERVQNAMKNNVALPMGPSSFIPLRNVNAGKVLGLRGGGRGGGGERGRGGGRGRPIFGFRSSVGTGANSVPVVAAGDGFNSVGVVGGGDDASATRKRALPDASFPKPKRPTAEAQFFCELCQKNMFTHQQYVEHLETLQHTRAETQAAILAMQGGITVERLTALKKNQQAGGVKPTKPATEKTPKPAAAANRYQQWARAQADGEDASQSAPILDLQAELAAAKEKALQLAQVSKVAAAAGEAKLASAKKNLGANQFVSGGFVHL